MRYSFILEWENAILSELDRTEELIKTLHRQVENQEDTFELLILYNSEMVSEEFIRNFVEKTLEDDSIKPISSTRFVDVQGAHYFELKNRGVSEARGESIIILDSDVIPSPNWLMSLLEGHKKYPNGLISGLTYIDYSDFIGKCFALCWFFPLPSKGLGFRKVDLIFSNNFIAKKSILRENAYPKMKEGVTRGADTVLWKTLKAKGIGLYLSEEGTASHPAPNGLGHFFTRALAEGRDDYLKGFDPSFLLVNPNFGFIKIVGLRMKNVFKKTVKNYKAVNLPVWQVPFVIFTMLIYYSFYGAGGFLSMTFPKKVETAWQI